MATAKTRINQIFSQEELDHAIVEMRVTNMTTGTTLDYENPRAAFYAEPESANPAYSANNKLATNSDVTMLYEKLARSYPGYSFVLVWKVPFGEQKPGDDVHAGTKMSQVRKQPAKPKSAPRPRAS